MTTTTLLKAKDVVQGCKFMFAGSVAQVLNVEPYPGERTRIWYGIADTNSILTMPVILPDDFELEIHH